jgi:hypothetical protein
MSAAIDSLKCRTCHQPVQETDEFCPQCGTLRVGGVMCQNHDAVNAAGVCTLCCLPFCADCGGKVKGRFLCTQHRQYEIYEGMARVFGASDAALVEFAKSCLQEAGLHPMVYSMKASPLAIGGPEYSLFRASGEYDGHIVNEFKLMVPCQEVVPAEETLRSLEIIT